MGYFTKKNILMDALFKEVYFHKFVEQICNWPEYIRINELLENTNYIARLDYSQNRVLWDRIYYIDFGIYDQNGTLFSVPQNEDSPFFDRLLNLSVSGSAMFFNLLTRKKIVYLDEKELRSGFIDIIEYLEYLQKNNQSEM